MSKLEKYAERLKAEYEIAESEDHQGYLNIWDDWVLVVGAISRINELEAENKELKEDVAEKQSLFDLQHTRTLEASAMWQEETGKDCFPDLGELVRWLMEVKLC